MIETGAGIVHTYVDASADPNMARAIVTNAKARRVSVCNALDCLLLHSDQLDALPGLLRELGEKHHCEVFADEAAYGRDVGDALKAMAERLDMQDLRFLAVAVTIQQQSGGNLAEILEKTPRPRVHVGVEECRLSQV